MAVALKINGVLQLVPVEKHGFTGWASDMGENILISGIFKPLGNAVKDAFLSMVHMLNDNSVEIISFCILGTSIGMMVAPMLDHSSGKWFGRVLFIALVGAVWRIILP